MHINQLIGMSTHYTTGEYKDWYLCKVAIINLLQRQAVTRLVDSSSLNYSSSCLVGHVERRRWTAPCTILEYITIPVQQWAIDTTEVTDCSIESYIRSKN